MNKKDMLVLLVMTFMVTTGVLIVLTVVALYVKYVFSPLIT